MTHAIVGATGNTGRVVAEGLLAAGTDVRAIGRSAERLRPLAERGADIHVAPVDDAEAMAAAFEGATAAYTMIPPLFEVDDYRLFQCAAGTAIAVGLQSAGVRHVVNLSSIGAQHREGTGPVAGLREQKDRLNALGLNVLHLRAGYFMENFLGFIPMIREIGFVGSPIEGDLPVPMIPARDVGAYAVRRLLALDFQGSTTQELLGPRDFTMKETVGVLGGAIGKPGLLYVQFPYDQARQGLQKMGLSFEGPALVLEMYRAFNAGLVAAEEPRTEESATPATLAEFSLRFAGAYEG